MAKLASRTLAVVGDIVDTVLFWFDTASSAASYRATWLVIRTKLETYFPTRSEVTAEITAAVAGLYDHKGAYNASTNTPDLDTSPSGIKKSDAYTVSVAGTFFAVAVEAGDVLIADQDDPVDAGDWTIVNRNIDSSAFATAAQGALADTAVQPADIVGPETFVIRPYDCDFGGAAGPSRTYHTGSYPVPVLAFDASAYESACFALPMPLRWDEGQFRFRVTWSPTSTNAGTVQWGVYGNATTDGAVMPTATSIGGSVDDAASGTSIAWQKTAWSSWFSFDNTPVLTELLVARIQRNGGAGADTYTADAHFIALELQYESDALNDA